MRPFGTRALRVMVGALIPAAMLAFAAPAYADRDHHRGRYHKEWRDHDRGRHWHRGHGHKHKHKHHAHRKHHWHRDRVVVVKPPPRVIYREPRVYYVEPPRYHYYEPPGVSGSVTFRF